MKKLTLILLTFVPFITGYIVNASIALPVIGMIIFYVLPLLTTVFWFYLGRQYARSTWKPLPALLIGNATAIVSLLIFLWQYLLKTDETVNLTFMAAAQMFSDSAPLYLLAKFAILFEAQPNYMGRSSMAALNILSTVYMLVVFLSGFIFQVIRKRMLKSL